MSSSLATPAESISELGFYTLAGHAEQPRNLLAEVRAAEAMGLGHVFISERWNTKEAATLSGAAGAVSDRIAIATAATNHITRHPLITAAYAMTMHKLTGGRFTLGLGRGVKPLFDAIGLAPITTAQLEDFAGLMRRLWNGETIVDHDGPAGKYPVLTLIGGTSAEHIPLGLTAWGEQTCALAGRAYDQVVLHTFFSDETTARCVGWVREAAEKAGRDPGSVAVWSILATIPPGTSDEDRLMKVVARLATYLQIAGYGDTLVAANRWDPAVLARLRADPVVAGFGRDPIDQHATSEQLEHIAALIPTEWSAAAAEGSGLDCAVAARHQLDLGVDGVILHGCTPAELVPVVDAYRDLYR